MPHIVTVLDQIHILLLLNDINRYRVIGSGNLF